MSSHGANPGAAIGAFSAGYAPGYEGRRSSILLSLLVLLAIINFIDRQLLQSFVVDIRRELELTYFQFSLLTGLFFSVFYTFAGIVMGALADRISRPRLIASGLAVWSAFTAVSGAAVNFTQLAAARSVIAVGEATLSPTSLSMLCDVFPSSRHGMVSGLFYLGIPLGAGGSLLLAGYLGPVLGWRGCFYLLGGIGVALSFLVLLLRDPPRRNSSSQIPHRPLRQALPDVTNLLKHSSSLRCLLLGAGLAIFSQGGLVLDQAWLVQERGYGVGHEQRMFGAIFLVAGVVGAIAGGMLSDLLQSRYTNGRLLFLALIFCVAGPVGVAYRLMEPGTPIFYLAAIVGSISIMLPYGPIMSTAAELSPTHNRATVFALALLVMALLGTALGNAFTGWLADALTESGMENPLTIALLLSGAVSLLSIPYFLLAARHHAAGLRLARRLSSESHVLPSKI